MTTPSGAEGNGEHMKIISLIAAIATAASLAAPAHADTDSDFVGQLHTYGIYGPHDYDA